MPSLFDYALPRLKTTTIGFKAPKPIQPYRPPTLGGMLGQQQSLSWSPSSQASSLLSGFAGANPMDRLLQGQYGLAGLGADDIRHKFDQYLNQSSTPTTPPPPNSVPGPNGAINVDYMSDPILQQTIALRQQRDQAAQASAINRQKQLLIDFGSGDFATKFIGDQGVAKAAKENPFSILAGLTKDFETRGRDLNQNLAKANLFYSGERGRQAGLESDLYLKNQTEAQRVANSALGQIAAELAYQKQANADMVSSSMTDAYNRALSWALMNPTADGELPADGEYGDPGTSNDPGQLPPGWGGSGGPGYGTPGDPGAPPTSGQGVGQMSPDYRWQWDGQRWNKVGNW